LIVLLLAISIGVAGPAEDAEADLERTELAFARTMAERDHEAFRGFLADDVVFFGAGQPLRGKQVVAETWMPFFKGPDAPFSWKPEVVAVLDSGDLGLTSGPVLDPEGKRIATFNSVWRRQKDGSWKIVFDRGCSPCDGD